MAEKGIESLDRVMAETLGNAIIAQRRLHVAATVIRNAVVAGELTYEVAMQELQEIHNTGRYLVAQAATVQTQIQPPLPGLEQ